MTSLQGEAVRMLNQSLTQKEREALRDMGFKGCKTKFSAVVAAVYKKCTAGDNTSVKLLLDLTGGGTEGGGNVTIINDIGTE